jgi:hypothetical protein
MDIPCSDATRFVWIHTQLCKQGNEKDTIEKALEPVLNTYIQTNCGFHKPRCKDVECESLRTRVQRIHASVDIHTK